VIHPALQLNASCDRISQCFENYLAQRKEKGAGEKITPKWLLGEFREDGHSKVAEKVSSSSLTRCGRAEGGLKRFREFGSASVIPLENGIQVTIKPE
jgi:hypothetical protein